MSNNLYIDLESKLKLDTGLSSRSRIARREAAMALSSKAEKRSNPSSPKKMATDRFMPMMNENAVENHETKTGTEYADLVIAATQGKENSKILSFNQRPKTGLTSSLAPRKLMVSASKSAAKASCKRHVDKYPDRIMDAPNVVNDFYCNPIDWGEGDYLAVALGDECFVWSSCTGNITEITNGAEQGIITSVVWIDDTNVAVANASGLVSIYCFETKKRIRSMPGNAAQVGCMSTGRGDLPHILTTGSRSGEIINFDVRKQNPIVSKFVKHEQEVTGLKWNPNGQYLASGGNDNTVNIWMNDIGTTEAQPLHSLTDHMASVKALAWCPWKHTLLASGGGTADKSVKLWNITNGAKALEFDTGCQVAGILWNQEYREIITAGGFPSNALSLWKYPKFALVKELEGHEERILCMTGSPCGQKVATVGAGEQLRIWDCWSSTKKAKVAAKPQADIRTINIR